MPPDQKHDEADAYARDFADRHAGSFRVARRSLDLLALGLAGAWLLGKVGPLPILLVILLRLMLPMVFGWMAGRGFAQSRQRPPVDED